MRWRQLAAHSKNREFLNRVLPTREGFTRFLGSLALRKRRTPFHVAFDASAFFPYGISVANFRPKSVQKGDVRNSAANKTNSSSRERASAVCSTRDTTCPPSPTPPRSSPRRRASRPAPPRCAPRPPRAPPRAAPSWSAPRTRRRVRRADISPVVNPSGPRARGGARGVRAVPDGSLASTRSIGSRSASGRERARPASPRTRLRSVP